MVIKTVDTVENVLDLNEELDITGYSVGHVLGLLDKYNWDYKKAKNGFEVRTIEANDISNGKGFMSRVFICTVFFNNDDSYKFALKVPTMEFVHECVDQLQNNDEEEKQQFVDTLSPCHNRECDIVKLLNNVDGFPTATIYYVQYTNTGELCGLKARTAPGIIMMSVLEGVTPGFFATANQHQLFELADCFASLHDYIDSLPRERWFDSCQGNYHYTDPLGYNLKEQIPLLNKKWPELKDTITTVLSLDHIKYSYYALRDRPEELNAVSIFHGDFQPNNVMWNENDDGTVSNKCHAIYDFQLISYGNPMFDLVRFIICGVDPEIYLKNIEGILQRYHNKLTQLASERNTTVKYSLKDCRELFELAFIHQAYQFINLLAFFNTIPVPGEADLVSAQRTKLDVRLYFALKISAKLIKQRRDQLTGLEKRSRA